MPTYSFINNQTGEEFDIQMSMAELDSYKQNNPHIEQTIKSAPALADPSRLGLRKPDAGFRDVLKRIKKASGRNNKINTW